MKPVTVFPGRQKQFDLFFGKVSDFFFQQEVDGHTYGGQRRFELMGHGGDHPSFYFILLPELGDVLKDHHHPGGLSLPVEDRNRFRMKISFFPLDKMLKDPLAVFQIHRPALLDGLLV